MKSTCHMFIPATTREEFFGILRDRLQRVRDIKTLQEIEVVVPEGFISTLFRRENENTRRIEVAG